MKRVVFLIYHPSMLSNWVLKLQPYMNDCEIVVLHIASLHNVVVQNPNGITLYDVGKNSYLENKRLIDKIAPVACIFLSFRSLWEFTFQRLCVSLNIPILYLEHGLFSHDTLVFRTNKMKEEIFPTLFRQMCFIRNEIGCILHSSNKPQELRLAWDVYKKGIFAKSPFEHYFLYSERSIDKLGKIYSLRNGENTTLIGYPIFNDEKQKMTIKSDASTNVGVLYVHQPLISDHIAQISYEEEKDWLIALKEKLSKYNRFTILLHPRSNLKEYKERFDGTGIEIIQSPNNYKLFASSSLVVGHYSTALLYALYFNKPTIIIDYPSVGNERTFSECFQQFHSIEELNTSEFRATSDDTKSYFVGEVNTYEHIANTIISYLDENYTVS